MNAATLEEQETSAASAVADDGLDALRGLHQAMLQRVSAASSKREILNALAALVNQYTQTVAVCYFERDDRGHLLNTARLHPADDDNRTERWARHLLAASQAACRQGKLEVRQQAAPARVIIAAPVVLQGRDPEAIGFIFSARESTRHLTLIVQTVVSYLVLWHVRATGRASEQDARDTAALLELLDTVDAAPDLRGACFALVAELQAYLMCRRVVIGLRRGGKGRCALVAISGVAQFDVRSQTASAIEAAMDEAVLRDDPTNWPAANEDRHSVLAHKNLCLIEGVQAAASIPLRDRDGTALGVLVLLHETPETIAYAQRFLRAAEGAIARSLRVAIELEGGRLVRVGRAFRRSWQTWRGRIALATLVLLIAAMAIPLPYRLNCDCQIEPVTRRFVAAPFAGTLEKSLVKPGDVVYEGTLLARMDGRELRWKRASVEADRHQAIKKRDSAEATHNYAEMQIAALEVERLDLELRLLTHQAEHLEIKSPVTGIVIKGDLERAEGAPLEIGQSLFEIAPLQEMVIEVAVPDMDVSFVREGQPITVRLDAYPSETWQAMVTKLPPSSEIRDEDNVFVAEADIDNQDGRLRPGMKGRAKIETPHRSLGWILFHRPWEYLTKQLNW